MRQIGKGNATAAGRQRGLPALVLALRQRFGAGGLTRRFMAVAVAVIAAAMFILGAIVTDVVRASITEGVAKTAASSIEALIANSAGATAPDAPLSPEGRARLDRLFEIGSDADATRLIQLRIFRPNGEPLYEAIEGISDEGQADRFKRALAGEVTNDVVELPLEAAGPVGSYPIRLLRLYTPLHTPGTDTVFGVAALYYSARALLGIQARGQAIVWSAVLVIGSVVVLLLLAFVSAADRTITRQRAGLAANLARSQQLSARVGELHKASEQLRIEATDANEQLLARVGSDIHDGPLQLLTLAILHLTRGERPAGAAPPPASDLAVQLTTEAMTELRNISVGLVLPELSGLTLEAVLILAIRRHEAISGSGVARHLTGIDIVVDPDVQVCLYRVVQESLSNAYRHSGGRQQAVRAERRDGSIRVEIANGPTGPTGAPEPAVLRPRLGLRGMQLRLEAVGGNMTVEMREEGTVVRAVVPDRHPPIAES